MKGRDIFISCDDESCDAEEIHAPYGGTTFKELERLARDEGWSIGKHDYCPEHRHLARKKP